MMSDTLASEAAGLGPAQRLYLLGHPVAHSKSAVMYNALYEFAGLPWRYELLDCPAEADARAVLDAREFLQVNITTPYKPLAFQAADERAKAADLVGGANVLVNRHGRLVAHNTDGAGCTAFLRREGFPFAGARIAVCGTGPTALSILTACAWTGARQIVLLGRNAAHAQDVLDGWRERVEAAHGVSCKPACAGGGQGRFDEAQHDQEHCCERTNRASVEASSYEAAAGEIPAMDLIVNATPLGMSAGDPAPFAGELFRQGQWAFDCVYGHGETAFVAAARAAGCRTFDGAGMLVGQAVETVRIVTQAERVPLGISDDDMFRIMADAAGFEL